MATMFDPLFHKRMAQFQLGEAAQAAQQRSATHLLEVFRRNNWDLPPALRTLPDEPEAQLITPVMVPQKLGNIALGGCSA